MTDLGPTGGHSLGEVVAFDPRAGLGSIRLADGRELSFHAVAIQDGSRNVGAGAKVSVTVVAGHRGRLEAASVTTL